MDDVKHDRLAVIKIEGLHCHKCEASIRQSMRQLDGVHEVEVDFLSGQASVLYNSDQVTVRELMNCINEAGYQAVSFVQNESADQRPG